MLRIESCLNNGFGMIFGGCNQLSVPWSFGNVFLIAQEFVNVGKTDSRADALDADVSETRKQILQQADLPCIRRSKIGVPTLGAMSNVLGAIPSQKRLSQAGTRRNNRY